MENIPKTNSLEKKNLEDINQLREKAINFSRDICEKRDRFIKEIEPIIKENESLRKALSMYAGGSIKDSLSEFEVSPWKDNIDHRRIEDMIGIINANVEHVPSLEILDDIEKELNNRMNDIKESLINFSGNQDEAYELIEKLHTEKNIPPLNSKEHSFLEKIV